MGWRLAQSLIDASSADLVVHRRILAVQRALTDHGQQVDWLVQPRDGAKVGIVLYVSYISPYRAPVADGYFGVIRRQSEL